MKILFVVSTLQMGGAERVLAELANNWSEKHSISVLTIDKGIDFFKLKKSVTRYDLSIQRKTKYNPLPHFKIIKGIKKIAKKIQPDFVISFVGKTNVFTLLALKNTNFKIVVCEHSIINQPDTDRLTDFFRLRLYKKAYKIGVLSEPIKKEFLEKYKNCNENDVIVIPNALNLDGHKKQEPIDFDKMCNRKINKSKIIVSLGRLDPVKGFDKLIEAFSLLNTKLPDSILIIFGEGQERGKLENLVQSLKLKYNVFLPGQTNNISSVLDKAELYACTSEFEGFGMAIVEALSNKIPVIAFDVPYIDEIIKNNKNGILIPYNNLNEYAKQMHFLLTNDEKRQSLIEEGLKTITQFSPEAIDKIWFEKVLI